jgi:fibro-slime domain-containing protein
MWRRLALALAMSLPLACSASGGDSRIGAGGLGASAGTDGSGGQGAMGGVGGLAGTAGIAGVGVGGGGGGAAGGGADCGDKLVAKIRDFRETHPDFEHFGGSGLQGIVQPTLGADGKPVYAHPGPTTHTTGPAEFAQWYNDVPGVNMPIAYTIQFTKQPTGGFLYDNSAFFPIDNQGFGNGPFQFTFTPHNFLFTTEIHTKFTYQGGENFTFRGDDDLWVFVNGKLAIDLGGLHSAMQATANFDALAPALGLVRGSTYPMDIFHAERHTNESNFRIETTISCFTPVVPR